MPKNLSGAPSLHSPDIAQASMVALKLTLKGTGSDDIEAGKRDGSRSSQAKLDPRTLPIPEPPARKGQLHPAVTHLYLRLSITV